MSPKFPFRSAAVLGAGLMGRLLAAALPGRLRVDLRAGGPGRGSAAQVAAACWRRGRIGGGAAFGGAHGAYALTAGRR